MKAWRPIAVSTSAVVVLYAAVRWLQAFVAGALHPPSGEIRSVSDLILAGAFGVALYLWLSLRTTRDALTTAERSQLLLNTQLTLAAEVQRRLLPAVPARDTT